MTAGMRMNCKWDRMICNCNNQWSVLGVIDGDLGFPIHVTKRLGINEVNDGLQFNYVYVKRFTLAKFVSTHLTALVNSSHDYVFYLST